MQATFASRARSHAAGDARPNGCLPNSYVAIKTTFKSRLPFDFDALELWHADCVSTNQRRTRPNWSGPSVRGCVIMECFGEEHVTA